MKRTLYVLILAGIGLLIFSAARLTLYVLYFDYFKDLSAIQVLHAFFEGVRFDASVLFIILGPICLMLLVPLKYNIWRQFWSWLAFAAYVAFGLLLAGDVVYFGYVNRHLANELRYLSNEIPFMLQMVWQYKFAVLGLVAGILLIGFLYSRLIRVGFKNERWLPVKIFIALLIVFIMVRGSFAIKPIASIDAYRSGIVAGNLIINGVFSSYRYRDSASAEHEFYMSYAEAFSVLGLDGEVTYPLLREFPGRKEKKNIVILIMESWSAYYMGVLDGKKFNVTPNFDRLAAQGALFERHYAPEKRSIDGIQAILTGIPPIGRIASLGFGLEIKAAGNLGEIAGANGYNTIFMQTSKRRSFYMDAIAEALGFRHYFGMEDIPLLLDYPQPDASVFGWDYDALQYLVQKQTELGGPFLSVFFSGTTHTPFPPLQDRFTVYPDAKEEEAFLNTLYYADYSLGMFMEAASKQDWFKDTIFIITADHTLGKYYNGVYPNDFNIPLLIYSPDNIKPGVYSYVTSHIDILPTVMELSGMKGSVAVIGNNVLDQNVEKRAYTSEGFISGLIKNTGWVKIRGDTILRTSDSKDFIKLLLEEPKYINILKYNKNNRASDRTYTDYSSIVKELQAYEQVVDILVNSNRWAPSTTR